MMRVERRRRVIETAERTVAEQLRAPGLRASLAGPAAGRST
jgi:hypothetical protein